MKDAELLHRAKWGTTTPAEVDGVARSLMSDDPERDPYTLIHILGRSGAVLYEDLVARYLNAESDPMLARIALQALCSHWDLASKYRSEVFRFARGEPWDDEQDVQLIALSAAGEMLRAGPDRELLRLLMDVFEVPNTPQSVRESVYCALARAFGLEWTELPPASRNMDFEKDVDSGVLAWAAEQSK